MTIAEPLTELIGTMYALIDIMAQESEALAAAGRHTGLAELARAKLRLVAHMDQVTAKLGRGSDDWIEALEGGERDSFAKASEALFQAARTNSTVLERQIDLSSEMLHTVGLELERLTGRRSTTYSRLGDVRRAQTKMPLTINQRY